jgi:hypothetical protein
LPAPLCTVQVVPFDTMLPCTSSAANLAVPSALDDATVVFAAITTAPMLLIEKSVDVADCVEEPIAKSVVLVEPLFAWIPNIANGLEVAMPKVPVVGT